MHATSSIYFFISWQIFQFLSRAEPANSNLIIFLLLFIRKPHLLCVLVINSSTDSLYF